MVLFWRNKSGHLSRYHPSSAIQHESSTATSTSEKTMLRGSIQSQDAPILRLPIELVQYITAFLEPSSAASFCLSTRYICFAVGTTHLSTFLRSGTTKYDKRNNFDILERAFPSHWYCAWCDKFHKHDVKGGPRNFAKETARECAEFNSYLHDGPDYILGFHHVRLALNRANWGPGHGIGVEDFAYHRSSARKMFGKSTPTTIDVEAKIVDGHLLLHSAFTMIVPSRTWNSWATETSHFDLPQIVAGHRDCIEGHTSLLSAVKDATLHKWARLRTTMMCSSCATDYHVTPSIYAHVEGTKRGNIGPNPMEIKIESWRDLGDGRNPFSAAWRAHGEIGGGKPGFGGDVLRLTNSEAGQIRQAFELGSRLPMESPPGTMEYKSRERTCDTVGSSMDFACRFAESWTQQIIAARDTISAVVRNPAQEHDRRVRENNRRIKAAGPLFMPPYGMRWDEFVDAGGMRGRDGIPLSDDERSQLTSGRGLFGG